MNTDTDTPDPAGTLPATPARVVLPASFFGIVLGLVGLGNDWRGAAATWGLPGWIGETLMLAAAAVWLALVLTYAAKWWLRPADAMAEVRHPVQCCFVSLVPVSTMLMAIVVLPCCRPLALVFFGTGAVGSLLFTLYRHGGLLRGGRAPGTTTPVLYLPTVGGNFVTSIVAGALGWPQWAALSFGAGLLAWLALESVVLQRLLNADEMPPALRPTLGIHLAPPAVGLLAYGGVGQGPPDLFAAMLLGYALLLCLLLLRLLPWIARQPFGPGYWAFTFGLTALSAGVQQMAGRGAGTPFELLAPLLFAVANLVVGGLAAASLVALAQGRFLPKA